MQRYDPSLKECYEDASNSEFLASVNGQGLVWDTLWSKDVQVPITCDYVKTRRSDWCDGVATTADTDGTKVSVINFCATSCGRCEPCQDKKSFKLQLINSDNKKFSVGCDWINKDPNYTSTRRQTWCNVRKADNLIESCPVACDKCHMVGSSTSTPENLPTCLMKQYAGKSFIFPSLRDGACFKVDLSKGGSFGFGDITKCNDATFTYEDRYSDFKSIKKDTAKFTGSHDRKWTGAFIVKKDPSISSMRSHTIKWDPVAKDFMIELIVQDCIVIGETKAPVTEAPVTEAPVTQKTTKAVCKKPKGSNEVEISWQFTLPDNRDITVEDMNKYLCAATNRRLSRKHVSFRSLQDLKILAAEVTSVQKEDNSK